MAALRKTANANVEVIATASQEFTHSVLGRLSRLTSPGQRLCVSDS